jgi:hypothetical protein
MLFLTNLLKMVKQEALSQVMNSCDGATRDATDVIILGDVMLP